MMQNTLRRIGANMRPGMLFDNKSEYVVSEFLKLIKMEKAQKRNQNDNDVKTRQSGKGKPSGKSRNYGQGQEGISVRKPGADQGKSRS